MKVKRKRWVKIRKGLPHNLSKEKQQLLRYAMLHDFSHSPRHKSKIYLEPKIKEIKHLRKHHENTQDPLITQFQKYDRIAASMTRKIRSPRANRYNWKAKKKIDFEMLTIEIQEVAKNIWKLYDYIYKSKELAQINESLKYGHTSLRMHLLIIANLIVQEKLRGKI